jgi:hypothetical protein
MDMKGEAGAGPCVSQQPGLLVGLWILGMASIGPSAAQSISYDPPPPAVQELVRVLGDPAVQDWLEKAQRAGTPEVVPAPSEEAAISAELAQRVSKVREPLRSITAAMPRLPEEVARASTMLKRDMQEHGFLGTVLLFILFLALGYGSERLFWRATAHTRAGSAHNP